VPGVPTLFAAATTGDAGYQSTLPSNKGSISATFVLPASLPTGASYGAFVPVDSAAGTQPKQLSAGCIGTGSHTISCSAQGDISRGSVFTATAGDTITVHIQENGATARATVTDQTSGQFSTSQGNARSNLMLGAYLVAALGSDPAVTFTNAMVDGSPLGYDAYTAYDTHDKSGKVFAVSALSGADNPEEQNTFTV
jgi:hypothetical protein